MMRSTRRQSTSMVLNSIDLNFSVASDRTSTTFFALFLYSYKRKLVSLAGGAQKDENGAKRHERISGGMDY